MIKDDWGVQRGIDTVDCFPIFEYSWFCGKGEGLVVFEFPKERAEGCYMCLRRALCVSEEDLNELAGCFDYCLFSNIRGD